MSKKIFIVFFAILVLSVMAFTVGADPEEPYVNPMDPTNINTICFTYTYTQEQINAGMPYEGITPDWEDPNELQNGYDNGYYYSIIFNLTSLRSWLDDNWWSNNTSGAYFLHHAFQRRPSTNIFYDIQIKINATGVNVERYTTDGDLFGGGRTILWEDIDYYTQAEDTYYLYVPCTFCKIDPIQWNPDGSYGRQTLPSQRDITIWSNAQYNADKEEIEASYRRGLNDGANIEEVGSNLILSVFQAPVNIIQEMLNFEILGINLFGLLTGLITLAVFIFVLRRFI